MSEKPFIIYRPLGDHPSVIRSLRVEDDIIYLERAEHSCIREHYTGGGTPPVPERVKRARGVV